MGQEIDHWQFAEADRKAFFERLLSETQHLTQWEAAGRFLDAPATVGYELESCLVDQQFRPADANSEFIQRLSVPAVVPELARSNVEFNGPPQELAGDGLLKLHRELDESLGRAREVARGLGLKILMIGILPTLREDDLCLQHISESRRYYAMNSALAELRGSETVRLHIRGNRREPVVGAQEYRGEFDSIMPESATTSFQLHMRLPVSYAAAWYNASLLASAPVLAVSANAPLLFGHDLWAETRIPVFSQSVNVPGVHYVNFGQDYLRTEVSELFERNLRYPPLLPVAMEERGLPHLKLHNGTIWRWNRVILDGDDDEPPRQHLHYRLEHRSLPSGPSTIDMVANAAFFWGLMTALSETDPGISFHRARLNFYRAARYGMDARLRWRDGREYAACELIEAQLLPAARQGLIRMNVNGDAIQHYLGVIRERVRRGLSGAGWQRAWLRRHGGGISDMLAAYEAHQWSGRPVAEWEI